MTRDCLIDARVDDISVGVHLRATILQARVSAIAGSVRKRGFLFPLEVMPGTTTPWELWDGTHRFEAAKLLKLETVPIRVRDKPLSIGERVQDQLIASTLRFDLGALEKAKALAELVDGHGLTQKEVAEIAGMSPAGVSKMLSLLELPLPILVMVQNEALAPFTASELTALTDPAVQIRLAEKAVRSGLTRDAVIECVRRFNATQSPTVPLTTVPRKQAKAKSATKQPQRRAPVPETRLMVLGPAPCSMAAFIEWLEGLLAKAKAQPHGTDVNKFLSELESSGEIRRSPGPAGAA